MIKINIFVEDVIHEDFLTALIQRLADENDLKCKINASSVRGGRGKVLSEFSQYIQDLQDNLLESPDLIIVATDSNCKGIVDREKEINQYTAIFSDIVINMIPEPHIERWLLLDSEAFKKVYGKGCIKPDNKCEKGRYKHQLLNAIFNATMTSPIDGTERIDELINAMDLQRLIQSDRSIRRFLTQLQQRFNIQN
ncbi:hypothetical protein C6497_01980 [Candidatus Poribacteria bacterium]|nr:MAG: hypothetical protein C6497_01980 [Candidatus Poribacteria bacterium]